MVVTRQQYQDEVKKYWSERCNKLQAENAKLREQLEIARGNLVRDNDTGKLVKSYKKQ